MASTPIKVTVEGVRAIVVNTTSQTKVRDFVNQVARQLELKPTDVGLTFLGKNICNHLDNTLDDLEIDDGSHLFITQK